MGAGGSQAKVWESTTQKENLNPTWNEAYVLPLDHAPPPGVPSPILRFEILNE